VFIDKVRECSGTERNGSAKRNSCRCIGEPMGSEVYAAERHDHCERDCQHLKVSSLRARGDKNDYGSYGNSAPDHGMAGRE
jgi:hypothetical protein